METAEDRRAVYRPSGKLNGLKFLAGLLLAALSAIAMAWCLQERSRWILPDLPRAADRIAGGRGVCSDLPGLVAVPQSGHCDRDRRHAGLLLYLGYYHMGLIRTDRRRETHSLDLRIRSNSERRWPDAPSIRTLRPAGLLAHLRLALAIGSFSPRPVRPADPRSSGPFGAGERLHVLDHVPLVPA